MFLQRIGSLPIDNRCQSDAPEGEPSQGGTNLKPGIQPENTGSFFLATWIPQRCFYAHEYISFRRCILYKSKHPDDRSSRCVLWRQRRIRGMFGCEARKAKVLAGATRILVEESCDDNVWVRT